MQKQPPILCQDYNWSEFTRKIVIIITIYILIYFVMNSWQTNAVG